MKNFTLHLAIGTIATATASVTIGGNASAVTLTVPGTSNPYLAGMPNGSTYIGGDSAPGQSPVQVTGIPITAGSILNFSATGSVSTDSSITPTDTPDGNTSGFNGNTSAENGIGGYIAPLNSLVGVFLDSSLPTASAAPATLNFSNPTSRAYTSLSPLLKQVFFIGDGLTGTGSGSQQSIVVPVGATRLFLGMVDNYGGVWSQNSGQFIVDVNSNATTAVPEPFTIIGTLVGGTAAIRMRKKLKLANK